MSCPALPRSPVRRIPARPKTRTVRAAPYPPTGAGHGVGPWARALVDAGGLHAIPLLFRAHQSDESHMRLIPGSMGVWALNRLMAIPGTNTTNQQPTNRDASMFVVPQSHHLQHPASFFKLRLSSLLRPINVLRVEHQTQTRLLRANLNPMQKGHRIQPRSVGAPFRRAQVPHIHRYRSSPCLACGDGSYCGPRRALRSLCSHSMSAGISSHGYQGRVCSSLMQSRAACRWQHKPVALLYQPPQPSKVCDGFHSNIHPVGI
jgi:hypothetical protein